MNGARHRAFLAPVLAAALITGLLLLQPVKLMEAYDLARMHQCYKSDLRAAVCAGEGPWWNPYTALGRPFLADIETATLYPPTWLVIPFGVAAGILLMIWLHLALAIEGVRRLGERLGISPTFALVAGISFALSGALLGRLQSGQLQVFCVICLWPWVWTSALRVQDEAGARPVVQAAVWLVLAFLAGSPPILWCGLVPLGALLLLRTGSLRALATLSLRLAAVGALATGLAAVQLLPFAELVRQGNRPLHEAAFATRGGESGLSWLTLLLPPGSWLNSDGEFNLHSGAIFFALACAAVAAAVKNRNVRALAAAGLLGFVLALGDGTFVLPGLAEWVPGFAGVRFPSRYALGSMLTVALLAAWWLDHASREKRIGRTAVFVILSLQGATLVAGLFAQAQIYRVPRTPDNEVQLMADLRAEGLPRDGAPPRVALPASILRANAGAQCGVSTISGFNSPALARTWTSLYILAGEPQPDFHRAEVKDDIILKMNEWAPYFGLSAVFKMPGNKIRFSAPQAPRAFLSFSIRKVGSWEAAVERVRSGHDFVREALVEQDVAGLEKRADASGSATITHFSRNRVTVKYESNAPGILVLAEAWYPGWTARLNDTAELAVIPVNGWMRGVQVPVGLNSVVFEYQPTWWWLGLGATGCSCAAAVMLWRWSGDRPVRKIAA
jgi:hypothetical protein